MRSVMCTGLYRVVIIFCLSIISSSSLTAQVDPSRILNPQLKGEEAQYLSQLISLQHAIEAQKFLFPLRLAGYTTINRKHSGRNDTNGIEFVYFDDQNILKVTGVYGAAYSASSVTENERAAETLRQVIDPILQLVIHEFSITVPADGIGVEIVFNTRDHETAYDYEGREVLTAVFSWNDARAYCKSKNLTERQEILDRSEIYLNEKAFGLAVSQRNPLPIETLERSVPLRLRLAKNQAREPVATILPHPPVAVSSQAYVGDAVSKEAMAPAAAMNAESEQSDFKRGLETLSAKEQEKLHIDANAPPSFEEYGNTIALHITLRNPLSAAQTSNSIYRLAAQGLDLIIAPEFKSILTEIPSGAYFTLFHFTLIEEGVAGMGNANTIDYLFPITSVRSLVANRITSQDLAEQSVILANSVRIHVTLQMVE